MKKKTQIVVVGGGAGGLPLVRRLGAYFGLEDRGQPMSTAALTLAVRRGETRRTEE